MNSFLFQAKSCCLFSWKLCVYMFMAVFFRDVDKFDFICISGSTILEPFIKKAVNEYNKKSGLNTTISAPGSMRGIDALISGECDIAMSSTLILPDGLDSG